MVLHLQLPKALSVLAQLERDGFDSSHGSLVSGLTFGQQRNVEFEANMEI